MRLENLFLEKKKKKCRFSGEESLYTFTFISAWGCCVRTRFQQLQWPNSNYEATCLRRKSQCPQHGRKEGLEEPRQRFWATEPRCSLLSDFLFFFFFFKSFIYPNPKFWMIWPLAPSHLTAFTLCQCSPATLGFLLFLKHSKDSPYSGCLLLTISVNLPKICMASSLSLCRSLCSIVASTQNLKQYFPSCSISLSSFIFLLAFITINFS